MKSITDYYKDIKDFFRELTASRIIYRELAVIEREEIIDDMAGKLFDIICDMRNENYTSNDVSLFELAEEYISENPTLVQIFRYNLSNVIEQLEELTLSDSSESKTVDFYPFFKPIIVELRKVLIYIDNSNTESISNRIDLINEKSSKLEKSIEESFELIANTHIQAKDLIPQAIAVLSIFMGILVVFFGGVEIIESYQALAGEALYTYVFVLSVSSHIITNFVFLLVFLLSRISKTSINVKCHKFIDVDKRYRDSEKKLSDIISDSENESALHQLNLTMQRLLNDRMVCAYCCYSDVGNAVSKGYLEDVDPAAQCGYVKKMIFKYPYMFFVNMIFLVIEIAFALWSFSAEYILNKFTIDVINPFISIVCICMILICLFIIISILIVAVGQTKESFAVKNRAVFIIVSCTFLSLALIILFLFGLSVVSL